MTTERGETKLRIEVWSDFVCPFCYIGKRHLEQALEQFAHRDKTEIVWKSFQLDPGRVAQPGESVYEMLAKKKGGTVAWAKKVSEQVSETARAAGLNYDFDRAIPANTFDAHRLTHLAATRGLQDAAEEKIMSAYFTEGRDIGSREDLSRIAAHIGLDVDETRETLSSGAFADEVRADQEEASEIGVSGVPFFLFNRKLAVSGAQPVDIFRKALAQSWSM